MDRSILAVRDCSLYMIKCKKRNIGMYNAKSPIYNDRRALVVHEGGICGACKEQSDGIAHCYGFAVNRVQNQALNSQGFVGFHYKLI